MKKNMKRSKVSTFTYSILILTLLLLTVGLFSCGKDDTEPSVESNDKTYAKFKISGPVLNKDYNIAYEEIPDHIYATAGLFTKELTSLGEDAVNLNIGPSNGSGDAPSLSAIFPAVKGTHKIEVEIEEDGDTSNETLLSMYIYLGSEYTLIGSSFSVNVSDIKIEDRNSISGFKKVKGTFSGSFLVFKGSLLSGGYSEGLAQPHTVNGEFEYNYSIY